MKLPFTNSVVVTARVVSHDRDDTVPFDCDELCRLLLYRLEVLAAATQRVEELKRLAAKAHKETLSQTFTPNAGRVGVRLDRSA